MPTPTILVNDTLQSYGAGPGVPNGFQASGVVFDAEFINFNTIRPPTPAPGFYERQGIGFHFFGNNLQYPTNTNLGSTAVSSTSVFWAGWGFPTFALLSLDFIIPFGGPTLFQLELESDYSVSAVIPGVTRVNSLQQCYWENTWQYWQINIQIGSIVIGGIAVATLTFSAAVDGIVFFNNIFAVSSVPVSSMVFGLPMVNAWDWTGSSYYGEFTIYNGTTAIPFYPNESATINMLASQLAIETVQMPPRNIRSSQMVTETVQKPSDRNIRASQMVVEIIIAGTFGQGTGFYVRES